MDMDEVKTRRLQGLYLCHQGMAKDVCGQLLGLQAQVLPYALHSLRLRTGQSDTAGLVKTWTIRGTMHLIPQEDLPLYMRICGGAEDVVRSPWYLWQQKRGEALPAEREICLAQMVLEGLERGVEKREDLRCLLRQGGMTEQEEAWVFHSWGGVMAELAQVGAVGLKVQAEKAYRRLTPFTPMAEHEAGQEMLRRYLTHYGPATLRDAAYFFHEPQRNIRQWLEGLPVERVRCEGRDDFYMNEQPTPAQAPSCVFLAGFDPLMMGYRKEESPFLPTEHVRKIFSMTGMVAPAVLLGGRVIGKWKQEKGEIRMTLFEEISAVEKETVEEEAHRLWSESKPVYF